MMEARARCKPEQTHRPGLNILLPEHYPSPKFKARQEPEPEYFRLIPALLSTLLCKCLPQMLLHDLDDSMVPLLFNYAQG